MAQAVVVMGVSGAGKTSIGKRLARALGFDFEDADRYHPQANVDKMAAGVPLTDDDRWPWLAALRTLIESRAAQGRSLVLGCSALKRAYREVLTGERRVEGASAVREVRAGAAPSRRADSEPPSAPQDEPDAASAGAPRVTFVYLRGDYDTILARMQRRRGHYMRADMLASQFRDLEEPDGAVTVDVGGSVADAVRQTLSGLAGRGVAAVGRGPHAAGPAGLDEEEDA